GRRPRQQGLCEGARRRPSRSSCRMKPRRASDPYWMLAPTLLLLGVFFLYPLLVAVIQSFYSWDLLTAPTYAGTSNYHSLWEKGHLTHALGTTLAYSALVVTGSMALGLLFAVALNRPGALFGFVRGAIFSAYVLSWVAVALLWTWILERDGPFSHFITK